MTAQSSTQNPATATPSTLTLYHGTVTSFDRFNPNPAGLHFGTADQAAHRATQKLADMPVEDFSKLIPVNGWRGRVVECQISMHRCKRIDDMKTDSRWKQAIKQARSEGYDALVYRNEFEGREPADSFVVFSPDQVVIASAEAA